jgi:hypothetical protein
MPLLQVRDCPEDIYNKLTEMARRERRTIAQQTLVLLEQGLAQPLSNRERRRRVLELIEDQDVPEDNQ